VAFRVLIVLLGAGVIGVTLLVFSALLYALASSGAANNQDRDLMQRGARVETFRRTAPREALQSQRIVPPIDLEESNDAFVEVLDAHGDPLSSSATLNGAPLSIPMEILASRSRGLTLGTRLKNARSSWRHWSAKSDVRRSSCIRTAELWSTCSRRPSLATPTH